MPTIVTKTIKPNGGGDFASLKDAVDTMKVFNFGAGAGVLSGVADTVLRLECYAGLDTQQVKVEGFSTDATHYVEIYTASGEGHSGKYDDTKYRIEVTGQRAIEMGGTTGTRDVRLRQLQVLVTSSTSNSDGYFISSLASTIDFRYTNCIARAAFSGTASGAGFRGHSSTASGMRMRYMNCIAIGFMAPDSLALESTGFNNFGPLAGPEKAYFYYNCMAVSCDRGFRNRDTAVMKNCVTIGCRNGWIPTSGPHADSRNEASSSDQDAQGTGALHKRAPFFVDPIGNDFRLHVNDSLSPRPLSGVGVDLSADADYPAAEGGGASVAWTSPFNFNIDNSARTGAWPVGPSQAAYGTTGQPWWCHAGGVTHNEAKVLVRSPGGAVSLRYGTDSAFVTFSEAAGVSLLNGRYLFALTGLKANTTYFYVPVVGSTPDLTRAGRFKTVPEPGKAATFRIAFSGDQDTGSASQATRDIDGSDPLFFLHLGDAHYENISTNSPQSFRDAWDTVHACPLNFELYQHRAVVYMYDDHDYGANDSDSTSGSRQAAQTTYRDSTAHHALVEGESAPAPAYHSFVCGRVRVIVTDLRSARSANGSPDTGAKTMMGVAQKEWFKAEVLAAKTAQQLIIWANTVPWLATTGGDSWQSFANERRELSDFMQANDIKNVLSLSSDRHLVALDDGSNDKFTTDLIGNGHASMIAAPLEQNVISSPDGAYSLGTPITSEAGTGSWGLLTIADAGEDVVVTFSGRRGPVEYTGLVLTKSYDVSLGVLGGVIQLGTYSGIQNAVARWLNREDEAEIIERIPDFVQMLEDDLRTDQDWGLERYSDRNGGLFTIDVLPMILPTYMRDVKFLWASNERPIDLITGQRWVELTASNANATGTPRYARVTPLMSTWMVSEGARLDLWPRPVLPLNVDILYIRDLEPLSVAVSGTPLSLRHPNIYIYGALMHAAPFLQHDERVAQWEGFYNKALKRLKIEIERSQFAGSATRRIRLPRVF